MTEPLSVVHVGAEPDRLGRRPHALLEAWFTLPDVASAVARAGAAVTVVQGAAGDEELERDGVRYRFVKARPRTGLRASVGRWATPVERRWVEAVARARPDVLHFNGLGFPRHVQALSRALPRVPILLQDHADGLPGRWTRTMHARGLARAAGVSFTAAEQADPFVRAGVVSATTRVFSIPETSSHLVAIDQARARSETGLRGDPCLLWLGHLDANKDPMCVLGALSRAAAELPDAQLWCAFRSAPLLGRVQARVASDPCLAGRVHLIGEQPRARVGSLLSAADFLVQGSHREGSGYAVIEALACGVTPLVARIPSFRALTRDGAVGGLFAPGDGDALAHLLVEFAGRGRGELRAAARRHFDEHLSFEVVGSRLIEAYRTLREAAREGAGSSGVRPPASGATAP